MTLWTKSGRNRGSPPVGASTRQGVECNQSIARRAVSWKHPTFHGLEDFGSRPLALARADYGFVSGNILLIEVVKQFRILRKYGLRQELGFSQLRRAR